MVKNHSEQKSFFFFFCVCAQVFRMSACVVLWDGRFSSTSFNWRFPRGRNEVVFSEVYTSMSFLPLNSFCLCVPALVFLSPHWCIYLLIWPSVRLSIFLLSQLVYLTSRLAALWICKCWQIFPLFIMCSGPENLIFCSKAIRHQQQ